MSRSVVAFAGVLLLVGCSQPIQFDPSALTGTRLGLAMPTVNGDRPMLIAQVRVAGGNPVPLLVDTGSPGLRILADRAGSAGLVDTNTPTSATFSDGTTFTGTQASAPVEIGGIHSAGPIKIHLIKDVGCAPAQPNCVAAKGLRHFTRTQPFVGILGVGLMADEIFNPLLQLRGGPPASFTISARPDTGSGVIRFNTEGATPAASFDLRPWYPDHLPNGLPAWASNQAGACWSYVPAKPACVPTAFDSGSPFVFTAADVPGSPPPGRVAPGYTLQLFSGTSQDPLWQLAAGDQPGRNSISVQPGTAGTAVNTGISLFATFDITFDVERGRILLSNPAQ